MEDQRLAVHRTIVVVDVEGFGDRRRTNAHQVAVRDGLYGALREAFGRAGIAWDECGREDRGDGVFVLVPPEVPKALLAELLPSALVTALQAHNGAHPGPERIRLRMALHAGEVQYDEHGVTAVAVNMAFRLVEAGALKAALASSPGVLAVIASSCSDEQLPAHPRPLERGCHPRPGRPGRGAHRPRPARPGLGPKPAGPGALADRGLPGRHRQLDPSYSCPATWTTGTARPAPSTSWARSNDGPGTTRPPPPA
jgi:hypothetical protein